MYIKYLKFSIYHYILLNINPISFLSIFIKNVKGVSQKNIEFDKTAIIVLLFLLSELVLLILLYVIIEGYMLKGVLEYKVTVLYCNGNVS